MKVEVDEDDLRRVVDLAARSYEPDDVEVLERLLDARARARRKAGHPVSRLVLRDGELLGFAPAGETRHRWDAVQAAVGPLQRMLDDDPMALSRADRVQSYVRDVFDRFGVSIRDEDVLFVVYLTATLLVELTANAQKAGQVEPKALAVVAHVVQSLALSLLPYLPPEARP